MVPAVELHPNCPETPPALLASRGSHPCQDNAPPLPGGRRDITFRAGRGKPCPCCSSETKGCSRTGDGLSLCRGEPGAYAGLTVVGRFSNTGGVDLLDELLRDLPPDRQ